jgi:CheY-like chemotaxis protein
MAEAERLAAVSPPEVLVLGDALSESLASGALGLAHRQKPPAEIILLDPGHRREPSGMGLGLLYSGHRSAGSRVLVEILERAFPGRLPGGRGAPAVPPLVLCVDDDPGYLHSISRLIRHHGYRVAPFEEATSALQAISDLEPCVALVDLGMPGMDGLELTRAISSRFGDRLPVVVLTGRESSSDLLAGYERGASYYLPKSSPPVRVLRILDYLAGSLDEEERELMETLL